MRDAVNCFLTRVLAEFGEVGDIMPDLIGRTHFRQQRQPSARRDEQIQPPVQRDEIFRHLDPRHPALPFELEEPRTLLRPDPQQGVVLRRSDARAIAAVDPALHGLELFGEARLVAHEHQPALGAIGGPVRRDRRSIGHAAPHQSRCRPAMGKIARVGAPDVRGERAFGAMGVGFIGEVIGSGGTAEQRGAVAPAAHDPRGDFIGGDVKALAAKPGRLPIEGVAKLVDMLLQLAHDEIATVEGQLTHLLLLFPRPAGSARRVRRKIVALVAIAKQDVAQPDLVVPDLLAFFRLLEQLLRLRLDHLGLADPVGKAKVIGERPRKYARYPLHRLIGDKQQPRGLSLAGNAGDFGKEVGVFVQARRGVAQLDDDIDLVDIDTRAMTGRLGRPIAPRWHPAPRMVLAQIADQAGSRRHTLPEFGRKSVEDVARQADALQPFVAERHSTNEAIGRHRSFLGFILHRESRKKGPRRVGISNRQ